MKCCREKWAASTRAAAATAFLLAAGWAGSERFGGLTADEVLPEFRRQAPAAWEKYREGWAGHAITVRESIRRRGEPTPEEREYRVTLGRRASQYLHERIAADGSVQRALGYNPRYAFEITRAGPETPWRIVSVNMIDAEIEEQLRISRMCAVGGLMPNDMFTLFDLLEYPGFRLLGATRRDVEGRQVVEVEFVYDSDELLRNRAVKQARGTLTLDPARCWLPAQCEVDWDESLIDVGKGRIHITEIVGDDSAGVPLLLTERVQAVLEGDTSPITESTRQYERQPVAVADAMFTLSHFGLPEPELPARWSPLVAQAALAGGVLLLVAGVVVYWMRR